MSTIKIIPLGGVRENGKNMYIAEVGEDIFVLDCGLKYPENELLGIDVVIPDFTYLEENIDFSEIYSTFLRRSINYQIIQKVSFESSSISQLAVRLYLSEATIFRKIKLLNSKIEEFQLKIKNVKMHGD